MNAHLNDPDWAPDPYESAGIAWKMPGASAREPASTKKTLSVTHGLTDDELRRFVDFDVYFDPMPMFGVVPQWVLLVILALAAGAFIGLTLFRTETSIALVILTCPVMILGLLELSVRARRRLARKLGFCDARTVTISPRGLFVQIPGVKPGATTALGAGATWIGPGMHPWLNIRKISISDADLIFWMRPVFPDLEGRSRVVVPLRAFADRSEAAAFEYAARRWHAVATGADPNWWDEADA